jgi:hypothetical protein
MLGGNGEKDANNNWRDPGKKVGNFAMLGR